MAAQNKFSVCQWTLQYCDFSNPALAQTCYQNFCLGQPYGFGSCTVDFTGTPVTCCSQSTVGAVASCMAAFQKAQGWGGARDACTLVSSYVQQCEASDANFAKGTYAQQAQCLCYDTSNNYVPAVWDNAVASCVSTGQSAHPTIWSALQDPTLQGLCTKVIGANASPSTVAKATTTAAAAAGSVSQATTAVGGTTADAATSTITSTISSSPGSTDLSSQPTTTSAPTAASSAGAASSSTSKSDGRPKYGQNKKLLAVTFGLVFSSIIPLIV